ncbi:MAG: 1-acyl-sn-glycerol-3-phosphate acyltransferase [Bernardetiaceae bacterium]|jgi:1-acyl-sn-glycerol-3-phosphate acyltransferase|nr:1-acyl-sn-glycerol-3-phosphate acyltransferase [Bernardetiaceae bacterium]
MKLKRFIYPFYQAWTVFNFFGLMTFCLPFIVLPIMVHEKIGSRIAYNVFMKFWGFTFSALSGVFYRAKDRHHLQPGQTYIFVANHNSFLDSPALVHTIPRPFKALGKKEILGYPVFGFIFRYIGVTVDRQSLQSRKASFALVKEKLQAGFHIVIFPEGTMNDGAAPINPFQNGAFKLAAETQAPIVPVAIHNSRNVLPKTGWLLRPGTITVQFGAPIWPQGQTADQLRQAAYDRILAMLTP